MAQNRRHKLLVLLFALGAIVLAARFALAHTDRPRDALAYYSGWGRYSHPVSLHGRISRAQADEIAARGNAYLIGEFNAKGQLVRVTKMLRGAVFFEYNYSYHDNGRLRAARIEHDGRVTLLEWDERGHAAEGQRNTR